MRACAVQPGDDVGDGFANAENLPQSTFGEDAIERLGQRRQALGGAQVSLRPVGITARERRAAATRREASQLPWHRGCHGPCIPWRPATPAVFQASLDEGEVAKRRLTPRRGFTLLNDSITPSRAAFSAFFHSAHSAFSLRADAESGTADHNTDTRRRRPFLNDPASLRGRFLNDVVVCKARGNNESCESDTGQNCSHRDSPFKFRRDFAQLA
jgi:hypothetical protein